MPDSVPDVIISQVGFGDLIVFFLFSYSNYQVGLR